MAVLCNNVIAGASIADDAAGGGAYKIERSLRFNRADSAYLNRAFAAGNARTWTWSCWVKRSGLGEYTRLFENTTQGASLIRFRDNDQFGGHFDSATTFSIETSDQLRDTSAWYHLVVVADTTNSTEADRGRLFINGRRISENLKDNQNNSGAHYPTLNELVGINKLGNHVLGGGVINSEYLNGYIADPIFIDGLALSPAAFGSFDSTGNWNPKAFAVPTPNTGTTYSGGTVTGSNTNSGGGPAQAFDGSLTSNHWRTNNSEAQKLAFGTAITVSSSLNFYCKGDGNQPFSYWMDGTEYEVDPTAELGANTEGWVQRIGAGSFQAVEVSSNSGGNRSRLMGIEVDGGLLVDGQTDKTYAQEEAVVYGNQGINHSTYLTGNIDGGTSTSQGAFEGDEQNMTRTTGTDGHSMVYEPPYSMPFTKFRINAALDGTQWGNVFKINNVDVTNSITNTGTSSAWLDLTSVVSSPFTKLEIISGGSNPRFWAIEINDRILEDDRQDSVGTNSYHLKFNDTSRNSALGKDSLNGKIADATGGLPIYKTSDDYGDVKGSGYNSEASNTIRDALVLAVPGDSVASGTCDVHQQINTGSSNKAVTTNGSIAVKTDQSRLYGSSLYFDDSDDYINFADDADWDISTGDYCIEAWVRWETVANDETILGCYAGNNAWQVFTGNGGAYPAFQIRQSDNTYKEVYSSTVVAANQWYHLACTVEGTNIKLYLNGILKGTTAFSGTVKDCDQVVQIGSRVGGTSNKFNGWINDLRIYKGTAKYTANFTPPTRNDFTVNNLEATTYSTFAPAGPIYKTADKDDGFSDDSLKQYLRFACPCNEGDGTLDMNDYHATIKGSGSNHSVTATGWTSDSPSSDTGWGYNGKSNSNVATCQSSDFELTSSDDFCLEFWTYIFNNNSNPLTMHARIFNFGDDSVNNIGFAVYTSGDIYPMVLGDYIVTGGTSTYYNDGNFLNAWYHWAVTRENGVVRIFGNGALKAQEANTGAMGSSYNTMKIGGANHQTNIKYHDIRYYIGTPKYTAAFTPSRAVGQVIQDALVDSPTNYGTASSPEVGGELRGNYCALNPLVKGTQITLSDGNLNYVGGGSGAGCSLGTFGMSSGKWYWEHTKTGGTYSTTGIAPGDKDVNAQPGGTGGYAYNQSGEKWTSGSNSAYGDSYTTGDTVGIAFDADNGACWFSKNGVWQNTDGSSNSATVKAQIEAGTTTNAPFTGLTSGPYFPCGGDLSSEGHFNFGQRPFKNAAPAGFKTLCTANLDDTFSGDELNNPSKYVNTLLYTGTGTNDTTVDTQTVKGLAFQPDLIVIKNRQDEGWWQWSDAVRGPSHNIASQTDAAGTTNTNKEVTPTSDGFTLEDGEASLDHMWGGHKYLAHCWDAGTTNSGANNNGSINISAGNQFVNATTGFSITKYEGTEAAATVGHGLNVPPELIIVKNLETAASAWEVYHKDIGVDKTQRLNDGAAETGSSTAYWNSTAPNNTVFSLKDSWYTNDSGVDHIAYCWASIPGFSSIGSYLANNSTDGPFIYLGFRPQLILTKNNQRCSWILTDDVRNTADLATEKVMMLPNNYAYESQMGSGKIIDFLSNGFKIRTTDCNLNHTNTTDRIIYAAWARNPFKTARAF